MKNITVQRTTSLRTLIFLLPLIALLAIPVNLWSAESKVRAAAIFAAAQVQAQPQEQSLEFRAIQGFAGELTAPYRNADNSKVITNTVTEILQILLKKHVAQPTLTQQELVTDDAIQRCVELLKVDIKNTFLAAKGVTLGTVTGATNIDRLCKEAEEEAQSALTLLLRKSAEYICTVYAEQVRQRSYNESAYLKLEAMLVAKIRKISDQYGCDKKTVEEAVACITKTFAEDQSVLAQMRELEQLAQFTGRGRPTIQDDLYTKSTVLLECGERQGEKLCMPQDAILTSRKRPLYNMLWNVLEQFPAELVALVVGYVPAYFEGVQKETSDGHKGEIAALAFLPDNTCASASPYFHDPIKIWDLYTGRCLKELDNEAMVLRLVLISPTRLAMAVERGSEFFVKVFDLATGKYVQDIIRPKQMITSMIFIANQLILLDGSHCMEIFREQSTNKWQCVDKDDRCRSCSVLDKDSFVSSNQYHDITIWKYNITIWKYNFGAQKWNTTKVPIEDAFHMAILPNRKIACVNQYENRKTIVIRDLDTGKLLFTLDGHTDGIEALVALPRNKLASAGRGDCIDIWNLDSRSCIHTFIDHEDDQTYRSVQALAVSPDGQLLVSGSLDGAIRFWDTETFECIKVCKGSRAGAHGSGMGIMAMGGGDSEYQ